MNGPYWKPVLGYEKYYLINTTGDVCSVRKNRLLKPRTDRYGYKDVLLHKDGKGRRFSIHRLVAENFLGTCPEGYQVNHKNCNKADNLVSNLEYMTQDENMHHAAMNGIYQRAAFKRYNQPLS